VVIKGTGKQFLWMATEAEDQMIHGCLRYNGSLTRLFQKRAKMTECVKRKTVDACRDYQVNE
jgi:hypothetical protein